MDDLQLGEKVTNALKKGGLNDPLSIVQASPMELCRLTGLSMKEVAQIRSSVCQNVLKKQTLKPVSGLDMKEGKVPEQLKPRKLSMGCPILNAFLRGGVPSQGITEVAGESASGKTQICLQLSLCAQLPSRLGGLQGGTAYICTEDVFPSRRLQQMIRSMKSRYLMDDEVARIRFGDHIFIEHVSDKDSLFHCIFNKLPHLLASDRVRFLVLDSTAALFRSEYTSSELVQRAKDMTTLAGRLHKISAEYNIPVVCVNQVTGVVEGGLSSRKMAPSLGLTWSNMVTTRLFTTRTQFTVGAPTGTSSVASTGSAIGAPTGPVVRVMEVLHAPHLPPSKCHYYVDNEGVKGLPQHEVDRLC